MTGARPLHAGYTGSAPATRSSPGRRSTRSSRARRRPRPQVAGAAALVRDWYTRNAGAAPSPALTKALLINTRDRPRRRRERQGRRDRRRPQRRPGLGEGERGRGARLRRRASSATSCPRTCSTRPARPRQRVPGPGREQARQGDARVDRPARARRWATAPGSTTSTSRSPAAGRPIKGNVFARRLSRTGGSADQRNNVESVYLPAGTAGRLSVTVRATTLIGRRRARQRRLDRPGLRARRLERRRAAGARCSCTRRRRSTTARPAATATACSSPTSRSDLASRSATPAPIRPLGAAARSGPAGGLAVSQGGSAYPDPERGRVGPNATPLRRAPRERRHLRRRRAGHPHDGERAGTQTIPLSLPTGGPGALQTDVGRRRRSRSPTTTPPASAPRCSSPSRGRIKDLDVTIPAIAHGWVGDLAIEHHRARRHDRPPGRPPGRARQRRRQLRRHGLRRRGGPEHLPGQRPLHGQLQAPERPALALRRQEPARHLDAARARPVRGRRRHAAGLGGDEPEGALRHRHDAARHVDRRACPPNPTSSRSAQFTFGSNDAGATLRVPARRRRVRALRRRPRRFGGLGLGTHSVSARAIDGSDNEDADARVYGWTVARAAPPHAHPPAPSFVLAPVEERLADALAGPLRRAGRVRVGVPGERDD